MVTRDVREVRASAKCFTRRGAIRHGKVIDDGTISRLDETTFRLTSAEPNLRWLSMNAVGHGRCHRGRIGSHSPRSRSRARQSRDDPAAGVAGGLRRSSSTSGSSTRRSATFPVTVSRTGYTGDLGYELWVDAERAVPLWDAMIDAGTPYGITPAGIWAWTLLASRRG